MKGLFKKILRWGKITKAGSDDKQFPFQQIEHLGGTSNAIIIFPYGLHANIPPEELALFASIQGNTENKAVLGVAPSTRPTLAKGEVAIYHPGSSSIIHFKADGSISITGNVTVNGDLTVTGSTTLSATVTSNGKDISDTHTHGGVTTGGGTTGPVS